MAADTAGAWAAWLRNTASLPLGARLTQMRAAAERLGCTVEHRTVPGESGRFFRDDTGAHIWLAAEASYRRSRFTLAHELGHLTVAHQQLTVPAEESWCDAFAAELLMPEDDMRRSVGAHQVVDLAAASDIAEHCQVTTAAAVVRLNKLGLADLATLTFRRVGQRWALYSSFCLPRGMSCALRSADGTSDTLERFRPDRRYAPLSLPMRIRGVAGELATSATKEGRHVIVGIRRSQLAARTKPDRHGEHLADDVSRAAGRPRRRTHR